jgi:hypothetical protein
VYQICGLRSLFPDDAFTRRSISGLNNVLDLNVRRAARAGQPAQHLPSLGGRCLALALAARARLTPHWRALQTEYSPETRLVQDWIESGARVRAAARRRAHTRGAQRFPERSKRPLFRA